MTLVLAGAGVDQDGVARCPHHEGLVGNHQHPERGVEHLRLHARQMTLEDGVVIGREEILRPPPRALALDHRVDGDVADPDPLHRLGSAAICCSKVISASGAVTFGEWLAAISW
jgi:hypothetical protein